mmetsp:Transcript_317/g.331  ORF Transcript_317/g.331 Transcript_317/m.331 type:complete len:118 (+) Transcript_317:841-1194(+)
MDGYSWKDAALGDADEVSYLQNERCLFTEIEKDRAVRCGCFKYLEMYAADADLSTTYTRGVQFQYSLDLENFFDLCGGTSEYITNKRDNQEETNFVSSNPEQVSMHSLNLFFSLSRF